LILTIVNKRQSENFESQRDGENLMSSLDDLKAKIEKVPRSQTTIE